jgi:hypothetical protein
MQETNKIKVKVMVGSRECGFLPVRCRSQSAQHLDARMLSFSQGCAGICGII